MPASRHPKASHKGAFTLISLVIGLAILALCAAIAGFFYQDLLTENRTTQARAKMRRIRDAFMLYQVRNKNEDPPNLSALKSLVNGSKGLQDPWGRKFILDLDSREIVSLGANGKEDIPGDSRNDDIREQLPPAMIMNDKVQGSDLDDAPPAIARIYPLGSTAARQPLIGASFTDHGSGIAKEEVVLLVDDNDVSNRAKVKEKSISWKSETPLAEGRHEVLLRVVDNAENVKERAWNFTIIGSGE